MTVSEKAEYLESYRDILEKIKELKKQEESLREVKESAKAIQYSDMPKGFKQSDLSDYMVELEEIENDIKAIKFKGLVRKAKIERAIAKLTDPDESKVLRMRYIELKSWRSIAHILKYTEDGAFKIRLRAIKHIEL